MTNEHRSEWKDPALNRPSNEIHKSVKQTQQEMMYHELYVDPGHYSDRYDPGQSELRDLTGEDDDEDSE